MVDTSARRLLPRAGTVVLALALALARAYALALLPAARRGTGYDV